MKNLLCIKPSLKELFKKQIYGIVSYEHGLGRSVDELASAMIASGIRIIQYREKSRCASIQYDECMRLRELTRKAGVFFIVNDHPDIARACDADGVHVGQDDLPVDKVRQLIKPNQIIGLSTHCPLQADSAQKAGADYIGVGPIYPTKTKKGVLLPIGIESVKYAVENINIPFVAIGGIKENNIDKILQAGANCIAMVTEITKAEDIVRKVSSIWTKFDEFVL